MQKRKNRRILIGAAVALLCAIFIGLQSWLEDRNGNIVTYDRQESARPFVVPIASHGGSPLFPQDEKVNLADFKGRPLLLHFWATWCNVCRAEKPLIDALWDQYKDEDLRILAVASYDSMKALQDGGFLSDKRYLIGLDDAGTMAGDYRVRALPETLFISAEGKVIWRYRGILKSYDIRQIHKFVKEAKDARTLSASSAANPTL